MASLPLKSNRATARYYYKIHPLAKLFPEMRAATGQDKTKETDTMAGKEI